MAAGSETMKALVKTAPGAGFLEVLEVPEPKAGPGQVRSAARRKDTENFLSNVRRLQWA